MTPIGPTRWAAELGLRAPVVCAPMGGVAGGRLASAVSRAGALGMIGMGSSGSAAALERELAEFDRANAGSGDGTAPAFGIGMVDWVLEREPAMLARALDAGPAVVSVSFGDWGTTGRGPGERHSGERPAAPGWVSEAQRAGALAVCQVASADEARRAVDAGVDAVIARGLEAGGHGDHRRRRGPLLAEVLDAVGGAPVLSAGALSTREHLAGALAAGASAGWVGTAFSACAEALTSRSARAALIAADGSETEVSRLVDIALGQPWPARFPERLLRTSFLDRWRGREDELAADAAARAEFRAAVAAEDYSVVPLDAGLGVGALTAVRTAAEVVSALIGDDLRNDTPAIRPHS
ncbi:nitronate monooxygenase [Leucobacter zeae]|nr:nitronate monooxygenase [Leucobacter zeae]